MLVEQLHQLGEVGQRAGEPVDLVDHHDVDLFVPEIGEQAVQSGAVEGGARDPAIVVAVGNEPPALVGLALDIGLAGSRWASSELNSRSRLCSVDLRV